MENNIVRQIYNSKFIYLYIHSVRTHLYCKRISLVCIGLYCTENFDGSGRKMFNRVLRELQEPDLGAGGRLAAIGCVYWRPAPIGATG